MRQYQNIFKIFHFSWECKNLKNKCIKLIKRNTGVKDIKQNNILNEDIYFYELSIEPSSMAS